MQNMFLATCYVLRYACICIFAGKLQAYQPGPAKLCQCWLVHLLFDD